MKATKSRAKSENLKPGDKVSWRSSQGRVTGKIVKKQESPAKIKGHKVAASKSNPQFIVQSASTGAKAAHKPAALKKVSS